MIYKLWNMKKIFLSKFPLAPMGVLASGSAHARPSARPPIGTSRNFPARMSAEWTSATKTAKIGPKYLKIDPRGLRGGGVKKKLFQNF